MCYSFEISKHTHIIKRTESVRKSETSPNTCWRETRDDGMTYEKTRLYVMHSATVGIYNI